MKCLLGSAALLALTGLVSRALVPYCEEHYVSTLGLIVCPSRLFSAESLSREEWKRLESHLGFQVAGERRRRSYAEEN